MAKSYNQKAKLLFLEQLLRETGENHAVTMQEILGKLAELGIRAERKSIYDDMEALRAFGMDIRFKRGKPGGYYLVGQIVPEKPEKEDKAGTDRADVPGRETVSGKKNVPESEAVPGPGTEKKPEVRFAPEKSADGKKMKLLCSADRKNEIKAYFGKYAEYKNKGADTILVTAPNMGDPQFFGWLTAMGPDVHIVKPKRTASAFRDYLKMLAREYKGI